MPKMIRKIKLKCLERTPPASTKSPPPSAQISWTKNLSDPKTSPRPWTPNSHKKKKSTSNQFKAKILTHHAAGSDWTCSNKEWRNSLRTRSSSRSAKVIMLRCSKGAGTSRKQHLWKVQWEKFRPTVLIRPCLMGSDWLLYE